MFESTKIALEEQAIFNETTEWSLCIKEKRKLKSHINKMCDFFYI